MKRVLFVFVLLLFVTPVQAKNDKHKDRDRGSSLPTVREVVEKPFGFLPSLPPLPVPPLPGVSWRSQQEAIDRYSRDYGDDGRDEYSRKKGKKKKLPPGLRKKEARGKELPPGWRKKIARGQVLDRDLRGRCQELPRELRRELPRPARGTKFLRLEDKIIRVVESTFEIVDVFSYGR